jgi:hypothetical protein
VEVFLDLSRVNLNRFLQVGNRINHQGSHQNNGRNQ